MYQLVDQVSWSNDLWFKWCIQRCIVLSTIVAQQLKSMKCFKVQKKKQLQKYNTLSGINELSNCASEITFSRSYDFSSDSYRLANPLNIKSSNGNIP